MIIQFIPDKVQLFTKALTLTYQNSYLLKVKFVKLKENGPLVKFSLIYGSIQQFSAELRNLEHIDITVSKQPFVSRKFLPPKISAHKVLYNFISISL